MKGPRGASFAAIGALACLALPLASASISADAKAACAALSATGIETLTSEWDWLNPDYITAQSHYWSAAIAEQIPACAVFPTSAQNVSQIVTVLNEYPDVPFAIKSGGHGSNVGWSSTDGGVLITMSKLASTVISEDRTTADIGPGSRWIAVAQALEPYNVTVVSGRLGNHAPSDTHTSTLLTRARGRRSRRLAAWRRLEFPQHAVWPGL
jgi:hypothetical protein